jgi:hypothetical protein
MPTFSGTSFGQGRGSITVPGSRRPPWRPPTRPPPGKYDPALDAQVRASDRGYGDLRQDTARDQGRLLSDFNINTAAADYQGNNAFADAITAGTRLASDYGRSTGRLGEDYTRQTGDLQRNFQNLATSQGEAGNAAGLGGGYLAQALKARSAEQARQQALLDQTRTRGMEDLTTSRDRGVADISTGVQRAGHAVQTTKGNLALALGGGTRIWRLR